MSTKHWPVALCAASLVVLAVFFQKSHHAASAGGKSNSQPSSVSNKTEEHAAPQPQESPTAVEQGPASTAPEPDTVAPANRGGETVDVDAVVADDAAAVDAAAGAAPEAGTGDRLPAGSAMTAQEDAQDLSPSVAPGSSAADPRKPVAAADSPVLALPIRAGRSTLGRIIQQVRVEHKRPSPDTVRLEEILNGFTLRPTGSAAISQGVSIATECNRCPWQPSASLLFISIRGAADSAHDITAAFHADPDAVGFYRLLGFAPTDESTPSPSSSRLPAKTTTTLVIEIVPSGVASALGSIEWTVDGKPAAAIPITVQRDAEPSDDARFAALLCTYAQWLAHDQPVLIDAELLGALTRENASDSLPQDRADLISLIGQSLRLEGR